jgi:hypothetical protein
MIYKQKRKNVILVEQNVYDAVQYFSSCRVAQTRHCACSEANCHFIGPISIFPVTSL